MIKDMLAAISDEPVGFVVLMAAFGFWLAAFCVVNPPVVHAPLHVKPAMPPAMHSVVSASLRAGR